MIKETFEDEDFEQIKDIKERSGLGWREFIIEAAKAYENTQGMTA